MTILAGIFSLIWLIAFLAAPKMGAGWGWDSASALGFAAIAGMLYLSIPGQPRRDVRLHEQLGYAVLSLLLGHALWFLLFDAAAVEFVKLDAPIYMWTGILSLCTVLALVVTARLPRRQRVHRSHTVFRYWHLGLAIVAMALAAHHVIASGFYLRTGVQILAFLALLVVIVAARSVVLKRRATASPAAFLALSAAAIVVFTALRNGVP